MARLIVLGTAAAMTTAQRDYTHLCLDVAGRHILIDCGTNAFPRLIQAGIDPRDVGDIVLTHRHIDHLAGLPILLDQVRLAGRTEPITLRGLAPTLRTARALLDVFAFEQIEQTLPVQAVQVMARDGAPVLEDGEFVLRAFQASHPEPNISLRLELHGGDVVVYSSDTGPHPGMASAYAGCTILIHECTMLADEPASTGHCRTTDIGRIAQDAGVPRLIVVHLGRTAFVAAEQIRQEIAAHYDGELTIAADGDVFSFG